MQVSNLTQEAYRLLDLLDDLSNSQVYLAGGFVRDYFMGRNYVAHDIDVAYGGIRSPEEMMELVRQKGFHTEPVGIEFGVFRVFLPLPGEAVNQVEIDIVHFRAETYAKGDRHPDSVTYVKTIIEDLARRDLTINAIALHYMRPPSVAIPEHEFEIVDPYGGIADIEAKVIRAVGNPVERFEEDALRKMRVVRFAARFGYTIEKKTFEAIRPPAAS